jgi:hypothetical protein
MDRYLSWLSNQAGTQEEQVPAPLSNITRGEERDTNGRAPLADSHFESNLSAWALSTSERIAEEVSGGDDDNDDEAYSDDFDPDWTEDAKIIAQNLGLGASRHPQPHSADSVAQDSPSSASSPFASLHSPPSRRQQTKRGQEQEQQQEARPPRASARPPSASTVL